MAVEEEWWDTQLVRASAKEQPLVHGMGGFSERKLKNEILNPAGAISGSGVRKVNF